MDSIVLLAIVVLIVIIFVVPITLFSAVGRISRLERQIIQTQQELTDIRSRLLNLIQPTSEKETQAEALAESITPKQSAPKTETAPLKEPQITSTPPEMAPVSANIVSANNIATTHNTVSANIISDTTASDTTATIPDEAVPESLRSDTANSAKPKQNLSSVFDQVIAKLITNIQNNWLVWVGGLAMLIGGGYLVKEISNHIEFSPLMRITTAFLSSLIIVALGEWFHHKERKSPDFSQRVKGFTYIPAAITATGLSGIYCTTIFAFIFYQLFTAGGSLLILATVALSSLALSLRQGPLMSVLGLIGGYTAPLWIGGSPNEFLLMGYFSVISLSALALTLRQGELIAILGLIGGYIAPLSTFWIVNTDPGQFLLMGYFLIITLSAFALSLRQGERITSLGLIGGYAAPLFVWAFSFIDINYFFFMGYIMAISFAATAMIKAIRTPWLPLSIAIPHLLWMLTIIDAIPVESLFAWLAIYLTLALYLIFVVPRMGWTLHIRSRYCQKPWNNPPIATSLALVVVMFLAVIKIPQINLLQMTYLYALLAALIWVPALRSGFSVRAFLPSIVVVAVSILGLSGFLYIIHMESSPTPIFIALAISIILICLRTVSQTLCGDRSQLAAILLLTLAPSMTLLTLLFTHEVIYSHVWGWVIFTALIAGYYIFLGHHLNILANQCSAVVHVIVAGTLFILTSNTWLTVAISLQIAVMALQTQYRLFPPANWVIKAAMGVLVARLTLLPLIPEWQISTHLDWILCYALALFILIYARTALRRSASELVNWFEGAVLHIFLLALFIQTNYWLTGDYGYPTEINFTSAVVFANQALVMGLVYSYRSQFTQKLASVYQVYSYLLWALFALMMALLNSHQSPLLVDNVSATAMPVFNMLTLGWLLPAVILLAAIRLNWNTQDIPRPVVAAAGMSLGGVWLAMSIRQFWQPYSMTLNSPTGTAELFSYSIAGLIVGSLLTWGGVIRKTPVIQRIGLVVLVCVALKVFLWDARSLDGFWRAASFLGLGASLTALGWLFQKLNRSESQSHQIV